MKSLAEKKESEEMIQSLKNIKMPNEVSDMLINIWLSY